MGVEQGGSFDGKSLGVAGQIYNISTEAARVPGGVFHDCMQATETLSTPFWLLDYGRSDYRRMETQCQLHACHRLLLLKWLCLRTSN